MNERQRKILDYLKEQQSVSVSQLSDMFNCSKVTIRNDIRTLAEQNLLDRIHGGAVSKDAKDPLLSSFTSSDSGPGNVTFPSGNLSRKVEEKKRIAACAYSYIEENDTIILDDSSACYYLALEIVKRSEKHIAVVTNSIASAALLADCPHVELYMVGGHVGGHLPATMGEQAIEAFSNVCVDKAFISVHSINQGVGLTSIGTPQMQIKRVIFNTTNKVYVLADSSKFGAGYLEVVCPIQDAYHIITDRNLDETYVQWLEESGNSYDLA